MDDLRLRFIGTANAFAPDGACWNGFLVNERHLFEAPPTTLMSLRKLGLDPNDIDTIVISHRHGDHFLGLPMLLLHWKYFGKQTPVRIVGPVGTLVHARDITERIYPGVMDGPLPIEWVHLVPGERARLPEIEIEALEMQHDTRLPCLGFACQIAERRLGYTGDTAYCDSVDQLARQSEVLVAECTSRSASSPIHMNLQDDIARVRARMHSEARLFLTHTSGDVGDAGGLHNVIAAREFADYRA